MKQLIIIRLMNSDCWFTTGPKVTKKVTTTTAKSKQTSKSDSSKKVPTKKAPAKAAPKKPVPTKEDIAAIAIQKNVRR